MSITRDMNKKISRRPEHPREYLAEIIHDIPNLTQSGLADAINVSFRTINQICNMRRGVTPEVALKLSKFFAQHRRAGSIYSKAMTYGRLNRQLMSAASGRSQLDIT